MDKRFEVAERKRVLASRDHSTTLSLHLAVACKTPVPHAEYEYYITYIKNHDKFDGFIPFFLFLSFQFSNFFSCLFY